MNREEREEIVRRFEAWVDGVLAREQPPQGVDEQILAAVSDPGEHGSPVESGVGGALDRSVDSFALWAALTALTHEVKLQARTFKELTGTLATQASTMADELRAVYREREREIQRDAERRAHRQVLDGLIDLRDRLARGLDSARAADARSLAAASRSWLWRLGRAPHPDRPSALAALTRGYELGIERLDQLLGDLNVRPIRCEGQAFDPRRMNAIDSEESSIAPEGTVIDVYRNGYEWNGEVFRAAQVKVSVRPVETNAGVTVNE
jgi:molecular chaperone GrpE (heat shock protein)